MDMSVVPAIILGLALLLVGSIAKILLDYFSFNGTADEAGRALFRHAFLGPDLVMFAFALLVASKGIEHLLAGHGIQTQFGDDLAIPFWLLVIGFVAALLGVIALWMFAGQAKYIPILVLERSYVLPNGTPGTRDVYRPRFLKAIGQREGFMVLVLGNGLGFACVIAFAIFVQLAFTGSVAPTSP